MIFGLMLIAGGIGLIYGAFMIGAIIPAVFVIMGMFGATTIAIGISITLWPPEKIEVKDETE